MALDFLPKGKPPFLHPASLVASPRIVGRERPDYASLETLLQFRTFQGKQGEALVLAIYDLLTSTMDGTYHFWPPNEHTGQPRIRRRVEDAVKLLNVYGWAICGQMAAMLHALYHAAGLRARQIGVPGHNLCEVFYDGRWHILDADMWTWFRHPDGHLASAYELATNPRALIFDNPNRSNPCNLPDRTLEGYTEMYAICPTAEDHVRDVQPHALDRSHTMDFRLRPGETLIRSQTHQGRYHLPPEWVMSMKAFPGEWRHGAPRERYAPFRSFGNGRWIYEPDLTEATDDFRAGAWDAGDLRPTANGLTGPGAATLRVQSPYIFCGKPELLEDGRIVAQDGVWLDVAGAGPLRIEVDTPEGGWTTLLDEAGACERRLDITAAMDGRYTAVFRLSLRADATLRRFRFEGFIMTAPLALPRLVAGANEMEVRCGDRHGRCTVPWSEVIDFRATADMAARWDVAVNAAAVPYAPGWMQVAPAGEGTVQAIWRFDAPAGRAFAWASVLASVREGPCDGPERQAKLEWRADGGAWLSLASGPLPHTPLQWDTSLDGEVHADDDLRTIWIRVTSGTAITGVEFYGHLAEADGPVDELRIAHLWREGGQERRLDVPAGATRYTVTCGADPRGHTIVMSVPSRRAAGR